VGNLKGSGFHPDEYQASDTGDDDYDRILSYFGQTPRFQLMSLARVDRLFAYKASQPVAVVLLTACLLGFIALEVGVEMPAITWSLYGVVFLVLIVLFLANYRAAHLWSGARPKYSRSRSPLTTFLRPERPSVILDFFWVASRSHRGWTNLFWDDFWAPIWEEFLFSSPGRITILDRSFRGMHNYRLWKAQELERQLGMTPRPRRLGDLNRRIAERYRKFEWILLAGGAGVLAFVWGRQGASIDSLLATAGVLAACLAATAGARWNRGRLAAAIRAGERRQEEAIAELSNLISQGIRKNPLGPSKLKQMALALEERYQCCLITDKLIAEAIRSAALESRETLEGKAAQSEAVPVLSDEARARGRLWVVTGRRDDREAYDQAVANPALDRKVAYEQRPYSSVSQKDLVAMLKSEQRAFYSDASPGGTPSAATRARLAHFTELAEELALRTGEPGYARMANEYRAMLARAEAEGAMFEP
jgi:hypothetical protein